MRPATPNAPPIIPRSLGTRFILASHQTCRSFLRASLSERIHYPILTILTEGGWTGLDCAPSTRFLPSPERVAALTPTARIERAPSECARSNTHFLLFSQRVAGPGSTARVRRAQLYRARRASTESGPATLPPHLHRCDSTTRRARNS